LDARDKVEKHAVNGMHVKSLFKLENLNHFAALQGEVLSFVTTNIFIAIVIDWLNQVIEHGLDRVIIVTIFFRLIIAALLCCSFFFVLIDISGREFGIAYR